MPDDMGAFRVDVEIENLARTGARRTPSPSLPTFPTCPSS